MLKSRESRGRRRLVGVLATGVLLTGLAAWSAAPAVAERTVPYGFFGAAFDGPALTAGADLDRETLEMVAAGVETMRVRFDWATAQRYRRPWRVPTAERARYWRRVGDVPTSFDASDRVVAAAARRRIAVLPVILGTPAWEAIRGTQAPKGTAAYAHYVGALVRRYGPRGSFWRENPDLPKRPIRQWQIWNEPPFYWKKPGTAIGDEWAKPYVKLLRAAHAAVKRNDSGAEVVMAGLFGASWQQLSAVYAEPGARAAFEVVALHPFTREVRNVLGTIERVRELMREEGDGRKPIWITELTWPAAKGRVERFGYEVTRRQQGRRLRQAYTALVRRRAELNVKRVIWHTWISRFVSKTNPFDYSGLRRGNAILSRANNPAYNAYRSLARRYEGCAKARVANVCKRTRAR